MGNTTRRRVQTGNQGVSCPQQLRPICPPRNRPWRRGLHPTACTQAAAELVCARLRARPGRARIGGRIWSHHEPGLPVPVELGAEFVHGYAAATFALLAKAAAAAVDTGEAHWWRRAGTLAPADALFTEIRTAKVLQIC